MLQPGQPAPAFTATDHEGRQVKLEDLRGRRVVLWFYPKADTPGCSREVCNFRDLQPGFTDKNAQVLGISYDTPADNLAFAQKYRIQYPLLSDPGGEIARRYGAFQPEQPTFPRRNTYVIDAQGNLERVFEDVNPKTHPRALLDQL